MDTLTIQNQQAIRELITDFYDALEKHCKETLAKYLNSTAHSSAFKEEYQTKAKAYCLEAMINECKSRQYS